MYCTLTQPLPASAFASVSMNAFHHLPVFQPLHTFCWQADVQVINRSQLLAHWPRPIEAGWGKQVDNWCTSQDALTYITAPRGWWWCCSYWKTQAQPARTHSSQQVLVITLKHSQPAALSALLLFPPIIPPDPHRSMLHPHPRTEPWCCWMQPPTCPPMSLTLLPTQLTLLLSVPTRCLDTPLAWACWCCAQSWCHC